MNKNLDCFVKKNKVKCYYCGKFQETKFASWSKGVYFCSVLCLKNQDELILKIQGNFKNDV